MHSSVLPPSRTTDRLNDFRGSPVIDPGPIQHRLHDRPQVAADFFQKIGRERVGFEACSWCHGPILLLIMYFIKIKNVPGALRSSVPINVLKRGASKVLGTRATQVLEPLRTCGR